MWCVLSLVVHNIYIYVCKIFTCNHILYRYKVGPMWDRSRGLTPLIVVKWPQLPICKAIVYKICITPYSVYTYLEPKWGPLLRDAMFGLFVGRLKLQKFTGHTQVPGIFIGSSPVKKTHARNILLRGFFEEQVLQVRTIEMRSPVPPAPMCPKAGAEGWKKNIRHHTTLSCSCFRNLAVVKVYTLIF